MFLRLLIAAGVVAIGARQLHKRMSNKKPDIVCENCGAGFDDSDYNTVDANIHTGAIGVACPKCGEVHIYKQLELRE